MTSHSTCCLSSVVIALLVLVALPAHCVIPLSDVYILCNTHKYATGDAFDDDLRSTLTAVEAKAAVAAYALLSAPHDVHVAYQCRGDLTPDLCSQCVSQAVQSALSYCPNAIGSRVQLDGCFLRYENYSFARPDSSIVEELCNVNKDNSSAFQNDVTELLATVTAAAPNGEGLFASASSKSSQNSSTRIYALAQCLGYLSPPECSSCLASHASSWQNCDHAVGTQIHSVSCYYRYETYAFYNA